MSTPATPQSPPDGTNKVDPDTLSLRAPPRPVTRLNRRMLVVLAGTLGAIILGATLWSLQPHQRDRNHATELYNVDRVAHTDHLDQLPTDYSKLPLPPKLAPVLGEPLPGDLGPAIVHAQHNANTGGYTHPAQSGHMAQPGDAEEAARAAVFFRSSSAVKASPSPTASMAMPESVSGNQPFNPMAAVSTQPADPTAVQNQQAHKQAFVANEGDSVTGNSASLHPPSSPYQVMAGTIIPAALVTGINSDLPGQVIANVTEAVYDTATGRFLLIPQGSRLIGRYDSQVSFGQRRVLLVWTRLILPDTSSISLDRLPGIDPAGYAGLEDGVDWHWDRILAGAALSTLLGVGAELAAPSNNGGTGSVTIAVRQSAQDTVNQVGQEVTKRNVSIQPTLTIRPGFPVRVMVNKDLILRPYQPLFFQRGASQ
ncbi:MULTISPECIES: TrbI/VirB10 family protein [unclassified Thiobacillus]|jgi:type IV secretion system protein TrbI|uniref:TrbI/VirB10 family protein n=1 Tax=Thiobacillus sedimenti TaxID=3110231 RepID=A0ABZ1CG78_9PROT|nr:MULTISPECIES: TrbI/VirB10 family protein [unclassified Thiobacillus]MBN8762078.1 TrbI/VirB10 family protein [Thiobacillus sp.]OJY58994.1 MAG: conjugal transfer protein TrbI [Thiobacillus sp. 0-1251]TXH74758.1 MAG: TrbI/VirB10 family protein [Thiobacillus sp.]WRS38242.1 TrbI/VirB10 family protein [Thiobacillus sp. SCUT-2]